MDMADDYESMTVAQLKAALKEQDLPVSGNKAELIARLQEAAGVDAPAEAEEEAVVDAAEDDAVDAGDDGWDDDDWDDEGEDVYMVKQKPVLDEEMKAALALRAAQKKKTPSFRRTEWFRYKRLSRSGWRAPHGMDNKQRRNYKYRGSLVRIGHGKVAAARFLHPSGFKEIMVHNLSDLETIDPETEAARVGGTVGGRKRETIYARADELGIRVLNRRRDV
jgi:large subunit ribosomal protein L32e